uniref:Flavanone 4-reductase n=1 Tax=Narcissus tazetta TaxID=54860 RepID=I7D8N7_NARTA|nr:dihydroflavonol 4-reductase [Narcissus tazetta]
MNSNKGTVCVTGAAGFIGSWLVMRLLEQGYTVKATARDPNNAKKVKHLLDLPNANNKLTLWKADLVDEGSFDEAIDGCIGVFHVATPLDFETSDPENEAIKPTVNGMLNILRSCVKANVRRVVFTSSAGTVCIPGYCQQSVYDENSWTDVEVCRADKMTGWMYFAAKTLAEKAAWEFSEEHNMDFVSIVPTLVNGPFLGQIMPSSMLSALALITRNTPHYSILKQAQFVHIDDLCRAHIFLFEHPEAKGRYICSAHETNIVRLAKMLKEKYPEFDIPTEFEGIDEDLGVITLSSKKLVDMGFKYKYSVEDMYAGAIQSCREKGFLPPATK